MKNLVLLYFTTFCVSVSFSQNSIDSLNVALKNAKNDIDKTQILNAIADQYKSSNPTLMVDFATKDL